MSGDSVPIAKSPLRHACDFFRQETGQSLVLWAVIAVLNLIAQIIFRREMAPGEFGTLNTALGVIGLMAVPVVALNQALAWYLARNHASDQLDRIDKLRASSLLITETFAWIWGGCCFVLLFIILPLVSLPRFSLGLFTFMNVFLALGGLVGAAVCQNGNKLRLLGWLLVIAAGIRVLVGAVLVSSEPWAESGLAVFLLAGLVPLIPALNQPETTLSSRMTALRTALDRDFLVFLGATFSIILALFLFSSADRIVAQSWFGSATNNNIGYVNWRVFDSYQAAGLLARALLWGTQPLLLLLYAQRSRTNHTSLASLTWFWIYLGALLLGFILLILFRQSLGWLFCGNDYALTALFLPGFAAAMVPLGLLQALGFFALASRRYPECFVLGGCSLGYTLLLYVVGRQPELMTAYMFGGALVSLMVVILLGVVRWGRQPEQILWNRDKLPH